MKAAQIKIASLETYDDCLEAISCIEGDYQNVVGGLEAWRSGYETRLTKSAENKIRAIRGKIDKMFPDCDEE